MNRSVLRRRQAALFLPLLALFLTGCDIVTAEYRSEESAEWRKTYELDPSGRLEITNVNGKIEVQPSEGNQVEVVALKKAKGPSPEAAKTALQRININEKASPSAITIETKIDRGGGFMNGGSLQVEYRVKVPAGAEVKFTNVNGGIDLTGLKGRIEAETTNGGVHARDVAGTIQASTTNGGLDVDIAQMPEGGVRLECTNGGIKLRLPRDAKATISARITNGGINADDLPLETSGEHNRRRLDGKLNGGGPRVDIEGTNGGITISPR
jgi:bifunctional DNA-binding transcriptional regulator/antitoxin component of YhaV-PrlF toxin-antitoxin module